MKTKIWVLTALAVFIVAIGFATETPKMNVIPVESQKALVAFESLSSSPLEIILTNKNDETLYRMKTKNAQKELKKIIDFSDLGYGNYNVCMNYGVQSVNRKLCVSEDGIKVGCTERLYEPYFCMKNGKLNVSFLNITNKKVKLYVYKNGALVSSVKLGKDIAIQKRLDLSKLENGEYKVVLTDWFKDHQFSFQI